MSVNVTTYIMLGVRLGYEAYQNLDEAAQEAMLDTWGPKWRESNVGRNIAVIDGMGGGYVVIGHVIAQSDEEGGIPMVEPNTTQLDPNDFLQIGQMAQQLGIQNPSQLKVIAFTHYT